MLPSIHMRAPVGPTQRPSQLHTASPTYHIGQSEGLSNVGIDGINATNDGLLLRD